MRAMSLRESLVVVALCAVVSATPAASQTGGGYDLSWSTIDGGGATASVGGTYALGGTIGQPDAGAMAGGGYELAGGFWAGAGTILLGDCKIDGAVNLFDVLEVIDIVLGKTPTAEQQVLCNVDCNALPIDLFDVLRVIDKVLGVITGPLECPATGGVLQGALTATPGRFNYNLTLGLPGANSACNTNFPGTHACTYAELQSAEAAGDLVGLQDIASQTVTSFWAIDGSQPPLQQCQDDATGGSLLNWEYGTEHTASRGQRVALTNGTGVLGSLQSDVQCNIAGNSWVGCCL